MPRHVGPPPENTQTWHAEAVSHDTCELGEGPRWSAPRSELVSVDIMAGRVRFAAYRDGVLTTTQESEVSGFLALVEPLSDGTFVACRQRSVEWWDANLATMSETEMPLGPGERLNDGGIDPEGRLVVGSMSLNGDAGKGKLWRIEKGREPELLREGDGIPNGIAWDLRRARAYWVDSLPGVLYVFDISIAGIDWGAPIETWNLGDEFSTPDGVTLDEMGNIWVAFWGGARVDAYSPDGILIGRVSVPASHTTSCVFGGVNRDHLFITTATFGLDAESLSDEPHAGHIFVATIGSPHRAEGNLYSEPI